MDDRSTTQVLVIQEGHTRYLTSTHFAPLLFVVALTPLAFFSASVELDEEHQVRRKERTANPSGTLVTRAGAKDWETCGVLLCEKRVVGKRCCKDTDHELGNLHRCDVFLPLIGGYRRREMSNQILARPAVA